MGKIKPRSGPAGMARAWIILLSVVAFVSVVSATATAWFLSHRAGKPFFATAENPLAVAEREGAFDKIRATLRWPSLGFGIEGNALVIEGEADSDEQVQQVIALVKRVIKADSYYIVHPYIERPDWITGRIQAMREGEFDYGRAARSLFVVDLMRVAAKKDVQGARLHPLDEAERILASEKMRIPAMPAESLRVEPIVIEETVDP